MPLLLEIDTDESPYEDNDQLYQLEEILDFKGDLPYPYNYSEEE